MSSLEATNLSNLQKLDSKSYNKYKYTPKGTKKNVMSKVSMFENSQPAVKAVGFSRTKNFKSFDAPDNKVPPVESDHDVTFKSYSKRHSNDKPLKTPLKHEPHNVLAQSIEEPLKTDETNPDESNVSVVANSLFSSKFLFSSPKSSRKVTTAFNTKPFYGKSLQAKSSEYIQSSLSQTDILPKDIPRETPREIPREVPKEIPISRSTTNASLVSERPLVQLSDSSSVLRIPNSGSFSGSIISERPLSDYPFHDTVDDEVIDDSNNSGPQDISSRVTSSSTSIGTYATAPAPAASLKLNGFPSTLSTTAASPVLTTKNCSTPTTFARPKESVEQLSEFSYLYNINEDLNPMIIASSSLKSNLNQAGLVEERKPNSTVVRFDEEITEFENPYIHDPQPDITANLRKTLNSARNPNPARNSDFSNSALLFNNLYLNNHIALESSRSKRKSVRKSSHPPASNSDTSDSSYKSLMRKFSKGKLKPANTSNILQDVSLTSRSASAQSSRVSFVSSSFLNSRNSSRVDIQELPGRNRQHFTSKDLKLYRLSNDLAAVYGEDADEDLFSVAESTEIIYSANCKRPADEVVYGRRALQNTSKGHRLSSVLDKNPSLLSVSRTKTAQSKQTKPKFFNNVYIKVSSWF